MIIIIIIIVIINIIVIVSVIGVHSECDAAGVCCQRHRQGEAARFLPGVLSDNITCICLFVSVVGVHPECDAAGVCCQRHGQGEAARFLPGVPGLRQEFHAVHGEGHRWDHCYRDGDAAQ